MTTPVVLAYIDPVSGLIFLQLLIGGCIGFFACFWRAILGFCRHFTKWLTKPAASVATPQAQPIVVVLDRSTNAETRPDRDSLRKAA